VKNRATRSALAIVKCLGGDGGGGGGELAGKAGGAERPRRVEDPTRPFGRRCCAAASLATPVARSGAKKDGSPGSNLRSSSAENRCNGAPTFPYTNSARTRASPRWSSDVERIPAHVATANVDVTFVCHPGAARAGERDGELPVAGSRMVDPMLRMGPVGE
jgi:hypothetical protein